MRRRLLIMGVATAAVVAPVTLSPLGVASNAAHASINCTAPSSLCTEVVDSEKVFGEGVYVGHDEPSLLFYSNKAGAGNQYSTVLTLPKQPPVSNTPGNKSYDFQLHPAFWFGMAMCDTQSYPELVNTCLPDSDLNIADPATSPYHAGTAFMEMQFYPPGWVPFQDAGGISCDATHWCAALNIDSLSLNPVTGQQNNSACESSGVGEEYVNFAFITKNGVPQAPPSPVLSTGATFTPDPTQDLFMNGGDKITVSMHDTSSGLRIDLNDKTTHQTGFMVASAANNFGQVKFDPGGSGCTNIPADFHPMYSTSSPQTRVPWAAHTYNIAFSDEIGHWDYCSSVLTAGAGCNGNEGPPNHLEAADGDDSGCQPGSASTLVQLSGCAGTNVPGFDGTSYLKDWPNGDNDSRPTPIQFTSFLTGANYRANYSQVGFETDLPRVEQGLAGCDPLNATGCTLLPTTDDSKAAPFYPYFGIHSGDDSCGWVYGNNVPDLTTNDFGKNNQYGTYDTGVQYTGPNGIPFAKADDFRNIVSNPCPA